MNVLLIVLGAIPLITIVVLVMVERFSAKGRSRRQFEREYKARSAEARLELLEKPID